MKVTETVRLYIKYQKTIKRNQIGLGDVNLDAKQNKVNHMWIQFRRLEVGRKVSLFIGPNIP